MKRTVLKAIEEWWLRLPTGLRPAITAMILIVLAVLVGCLSGCGGTLPVVPARTAIPVECKEPIPQAPAMPTDNLGAEPPLDASVQAMTAEIEARKGYEDQLVTALQACTKPIGGTK